MICVLLCDRAYFIHSGVAEIVKVVVVVVPLALAVQISPYTKENIFRQELTTADLGSYVPARALSVSSSESMHLGNAKEIQDETGMICRLL